MDSLSNYLQHNISSNYPIFGKNYKASDFMLMDFTENNTELYSSTFTSVAEISNYLFDKIEKSGHKAGIGGYAENRTLYSQRPSFNTDNEPRTIHLGVDIWAKAGTQIFAPLSGTIHSFKDNAIFGDYGPTIIVEHNLNEHKFYSLYGHLSRKSLHNLQIGKEFKAGDLLCEIGNFPENGDWPPHLHFQLIKDIGTQVGDYIGVCKKSEMEYYLGNCPDPNLVLHFY